MLSLSGSLDLDQHASTNSLTSVEDFHIQIKQNLKKSTAIHKCRVKQKLKNTVMGTVKNLTLSSHYDIIIDSLINVNICV